MAYVFVSVQFLKFVSRFEFAMNALGVFTIILVCIAVGVLDLFLFGVTLMFGYFLRVFMVPKANVMLSLVVVESIYIYIFFVFIHAQEQTCTTLCPWVRLCPWIRPWVRMFAWLCGL